MTNKSAFALLGLTGILFNLYLIATAETWFGRIVATAFLAYFFFDTMRNIGWLS